MSLTQKDIENREDISRLVHLFYDKIRVDDLLGPIFNTHIPQEEWPKHLEKLIDFWETNLMGIRKFKGSPTQKHVKVDQSMNYQMSQKHFGQWLHLWFTTIDELFEGSLASRAKEAARKMATGQFLMVWQSRPDHLKKIN